MTLQEFYDQRDFYIGKKILFTRGKSSVVTDIKFGAEGLPDDFLCIFFEGGSRPLGGIAQTCSISKYDKFTSIGIMYCGSFDILH